VKRTIVGSVQLWRWHRKVTKSAIRSSSVSARPSGSVAGTREPQVGGAVLAHWNVSGTGTDQASAASVTNLSITAVALRVFVGPADRVEAGSKLSLDEEARASSDTTPEPELSP
jgi:hypothetical protein